MMYEVIEEFVDLRDNNHVYRVGDKFPHDGREISEERINELSGNENKRHMPLIKDINAKAEPVEVEVEEKAEAEPKTEDVADVEVKEDFMNVPVKAVEESADSAEDSVEVVEEAVEEKPKRGRKQK